MSLSIGSFQTYSGTSVVDFTDTLALSSSLVIATYRISSTAYVIAGTINADNSITWGSAVSLGDQKSISIAKLDATNFVLAFSYRDDGSYNERTIFAVCSVSGNTITKGSNQDWGSNNYGIHQMLRIAGLSSSSFVVLYDNGPALKARACTISSGTITFGSETSIAGAIAGTGKSVDVISLSSTLFIVAYTLNSDFKVYINACTVSTRTITVGSSPVAIHTGNTSFAVYSHTNSLSMLSATSFVVSYMSDSGIASHSNAVYARACTVSGTTITAGSQTTIKSSSSGYGYFPYVCAVSSTGFIVSYLTRYNDGSSWSWGYTSSWTVSSTTISALDSDTLTAYAVSGSNPPNIKRYLSNLPVSSTKAIIGFRDGNGSNYGKAAVITVTFSTNYTATYTDSVSLSEVKKKDTAKTLSDSFSLSDSIKVILGVVRIFTEVITFTDSRIKQIAKTISETLSLSDVLTKFKGVFINLVDNLTLSEQRTLSTIKAFFESISLFEVLTKAKTILRTFSESLIITETTNFLKSLVRTFTDTLTLADSISVTSIISRVFTETINLTEIVSKNIAKMVYDIINVSDTTLKAIVKNISESLTLGESIIKQSVKNFVDSIATSDALINASNFLREFIDSVSITEKLKRYLNGIEIIWEKITKSLSTVFSKEAKHSSSYSKESKHTSNWTKL